MNKLLEKIDWEFFIDNRLNKILTTKECKNGIDAIEKAFCEKVGLSYNEVINTYGEDIFNHVIITVVKTMEELGSYDTLALLIMYASENLTEYKKQCANYGAPEILKYAKKHFYDSVYDLGEFIYSYLRALDAGYDTDEMFGLDFDGQFKNKFWNKLEPIKVHKNLLALLSVNY